MTLPAGAKVLGETSSGDLDIAGMTEIGLKTTSGDKTLRDISGAVTLEGSSGKITLARVGGAATVKSTSGDVILSTVKGDVTVQLTSGSVSGTDLGGQATVSASSGDINLGLSATHNVKATATSGNVYVKVPRGTPYRVTAQTSSGNRDINVATDPAAGAAMDLQANSGDIAVNYA
ncbi:DUF4097 domain-containing protein [Kibdelosporangium lantanae]|uniref:DUF4097 domain-containing protein n=1 Tax=Kibdelosporangium lantanae TaxID=1497396 RepID=A0ABW3M3K5_9PSEU